METESTMQMAPSESRKYLDCREVPSENNCSLKISGTIDEVLKAGVEHAVSSHGHQDTPEFREQFKSAMKDE